MLFALAPRAEFVDLWLGDRADQKPVFAIMAESYFNKSHFVHVLDFHCIHS